MLSKKFDIKKLLKELILISLGCAIYAFSFTHLIVQSKMAEGGGAGVALLIYYITGLKTSIGTVLVNVPLIILGCKTLPRKTMIYTVYGIFMLSMWLAFFENFNITIDLHGERLLAALFGGILAGTGLFLVFLNGGSTGGVDILAIIFKKYYKIPIGRSIQVIDAIIIILTLGVLKDVPAILYTLIYIYVFTIVLDKLLEGGYPGKAVMIISPKIEIISLEVSNRLNRGMTYLKGAGSYTGREYLVGYCVVSLTEIKDLKEIVREIDKDAFVTINNVHDIQGEGFSKELRGR